MVKKSRKASRKRSHSWIKKKTSSNLWKEFKKIILRLVRYLWRSPSLFILLRWSLQFFVSFISDVLAPKRMAMGLTNLFVSFIILSFCRLFYLSTNTGVIFKKTSRTIQCPHWILSLLFHFIMDHFTDTILFLILLIHRIWSIFVEYIQDWTSYALLWPLLEYTELKARVEHWFKMNSLKSIKMKLKERLLIFCTCLKILKVIKEKKSFEFLANFYKVNYIL